MDSPGFKELRNKMGDQKEEEEKKGGETDGVQEEEVVSG